MGAKLSSPFCMKSPMMPTNLDPLAIPERQSTSPSKKSGGSLQKVWLLSMWILPTIWLARVDWTGRCRAAKANAGSSLRNPQIREVPFRAGPHPQRHRPLGIAKFQIVDDQARLRCPVDEQPRLGPL